MTFAEYLRSKRRTYTASALALREALLGLPAEVRDREQVYAWLIEQRASVEAITAAREAFRNYQTLMRERRGS